MKETLAQLITRLQEEKGLKDVQLAEKLGYSSQLIGQYKRGEKNPKLKFYLKWEEVFGEDLKQMIHGGGEKVSHETTRGDVYRTIIEQNSDYKLVPSAIIDGEYRMIPERTVQLQERLVDQLIEENKKLWVLVSKAVQPKDGK